MANFVEENHQVSEIGESNVDVDPSVLNGVRSGNRSSFRTSQRVYKPVQNGRNDLGTPLYPYGGNFQGQQYNTTWGTDSNMQFDQGRISSGNAGGYGSYGNSSYNAQNGSSYSGQNTSYSGQNTSYTAQSGSYTGQSGNYTGQNGSYIHSSYGGTTTNATTSYAGNSYGGSGSSNYASRMPLMGNGQMLNSGNMPQGMPMASMNPMGASTVPGSTIGTSTVPGASTVPGTSTGSALVLSNLEEIAYLFTYRYYSLLNNNPSSMYNLYSKEGHLSKPDLSGKRVVAMDHNEIRSYYQQFGNVSFTSNIQNIEIQPINNQGLLLILITGTFTLVYPEGHDGLEETRHFSQSVVLSGDLSRSRFHVVNDVLVETGEKRDEKVTGGAATETVAVTPAVSTVPQGDVTVQEAKKLNADKDSFKLAIFGIPHMVTEGILRDLLNQRLKKLNHDGRVVDIALKLQKPTARNKNTNESFLYAFVELDSPESAELLLLNGLQIHDKVITLEAYKRNTDRKKHEGKPKVPELLGKIKR